MENHMSIRLVAALAMMFLGHSASADILLTCGTKTARECLGTAGKQYGVLAYAQTTKGYHILKNALDTCQVDLSASAFDTIEKNKLCSFEHMSQTWSCKLPSKICSPVDPRVNLSNGHPTCIENNADNVVVYTTIPAQPAQPGVLGTEEGQKALFCVPKSRIPAIAQESRPRSSAGQTTGCKEIEPLECAAGQKPSFIVDHATGCKKEAICVRSGSGSSSQR